ncbi:MAG: type II secretion system F family protein, partial [candidate division Zixibacteria bacterium]
MPEFEYKGKTLAGAPVEGAIKANSKSDVERVLRQNRILVSSINKKAANIEFKFGTGIKKVEVSRFTRQFATMIGAGLPMVQCLDILASQTENKEMAKIVTQVKDGVQSGSTLSDSLSRHLKVFDQLYVNMVEAGEVGGALDAILIRLAVYREKADALVRKVKGAMVYPSVIVVVAGGVTFAMLAFIVPVFAKMFSGVGSELPAPTQFILSISHFLQEQFLALVFGTIGALTAFIFWKRTPGGALMFDKILLMTPVFGNLVRKSSVARFTRTLSTLLASGVSILDALEITAKTSGNLVVANAINKSVLAIAEGDTITGPLKASGVFPPMVTQMIGVGEKTGGL